MLGSSTVTTLESMTAPLEELDFPTVTVCNNHQMTTEFLREIGVSGNLVWPRNAATQLLLDQFEYSILTGQKTMNTRKKRAATSVTGTVTGIDTGTGMGTDIGNDTVTVTGTGMGTDMGNNTGTDTGTGMGPDIGNNTGTETGTGMGPDTGNNTGTDTGTGIGTDMDTNTGTDTGPGMGTDMGNNTGTYMGTNTGTDTGTGMGTDKGTVMGNITGTDTGTLMGTAVGNNHGPDTGTGMGTVKGTDTVATVEKLLANEKGQRALCSYANKMVTPITAYFDKTNKVCKNLRDNLLTTRKAASNMQFVMSVKYQNSEEKTEENYQVLTDFGICTKLDPKEIFKDALVPESSNGKEMGLSILLDTEKYRSWYQNDNTKVDLGAVLLIHGSKEKATTLLSAVEVPMNKLSLVSLSPVSVSTSTDSVTG